MKLPLLIADENIPFLRGKLEHAFRVLYLPSERITASVVKEASGLIIRSVTKINKELLYGSRVRLIASATIGADHIDKDFCKKHNIHYSVAKGCNANAVTQYVLSALLGVHQKRAFTFKNKTMGIVGAGNIGAMVADISKKLGMKVLINDPPRARVEGSEGFCELDEILQKADIVTFHVPLIKSGLDKTIHLADNEFFQKLKKKVLFLNTSRGEVVETNALIVAMEKSIVQTAVIDVWENEPDINRSLLQKVFIATPHIAGYSIQGKYKATQMCLDAVCDFFSVDLNSESAFDYYNTELKPTFIKLEKDDLIHSLAKEVLKIYDIFTDTEELKTNPQLFSNLRNQYSYRNEFTFDFEI